MTSLDPTAFDAVVRARHSVRGYRPEPVADAVIDAAFQTALWAPSNCNVQPWSVHLVSGTRLRRLGEAMIAQAQSGKPAPDVPMDTAYRDEFRKRQIGSAVALYGAMGIARDDHAGRTAAFLRNLDAFGAPHAAFVFLPEGFGTREAADLGGFVQTLMLALTAQGLGSCAQGALSLYPDVIRAELGLTPGPQLMCGIAFGYEDPDHPANTARTDRVSLAGMVTRHT
ncbi:nitroreductase [Pararhodobacter zhoushanensis]|uniref:nitroreductase n=1 Tax=Pararhodobacter zhoushanensis TaxID=2479545 RepID=UPI000F8D9980|nr:nitroreductase [Pararhodobacter zhoushanensis]